MTSRQKVEMVVGDALKMTQGVATHNKTMFKINKAAAIANAVINTAQGVTRSLADYPMPLAAVMAALAAAAGLAQISAIKSTSFQGGGTGTTPSAAGATPTVNNQPVAGVGGSEASLQGPFDVGAGGGAAGTLPGQEVTIRLDGLEEGGMLTTDQVRALMGSISDQIGDGVTIDTGG